MPTPPYAKVLASVNGGALTSGGLEVAGSSTVALQGENISGWTSQRWEIYEYPAGFACPTGWFTDASSGAYYSLAITPPTFTLPTTSTWGKFLVRLTVNNGLLNGGPPPAGSPLVDVATAFSILSPTLHLHDVGFDETDQFDAQRQWMGQLKSDLRLIDQAGGGGGGGGTVPSGTGFVHVTGGVQDGAARAVDFGTADITGVAPVAHGGTGLSAVGAANSVLTSNGSALAFAASLVLAGLTLTGLAGGGSRMVTVDNSGVVGAQAIPSGGSGFTAGGDLAGTSTSQQVQALTGSGGITTVRATSGHLTWDAATDTGAFVSWDGTRTAGPRITQAQAASGAGLNLLIEGQAAAAGSNAMGGSIIAFAGQDDGTALGTTLSGMEVWKRGGTDGTTDLEIVRITLQPGGVAAIIGAGGTNGVGGSMAGFQIASYAEVSVASHAVLNCSVAGLLQNTYFWVQKTDNPTGDDQATKIDYIVDKATSGDDTGLWINRNVNLGHAPGQARYIDIWNGGVRQGDIRPVSGLSGLEINSSTYLNLIGTTQVHGQGGAVTWDTASWSIAYAGVWGLTIAVDSGTGATSIAKKAASPSLTYIGDTYQFASTSGPTITSGAGAPTSTPANGSFYLRTDGTSTTTAYVRAAAAWTALGSGGGGTPGGSTTQMQYNNAGAFGGTAEFTYASSVLSCSATGAIAFGTTPATTAYLRFAQTSTMIAFWGGAANAVAMESDSGNNLYVGGTSAGGSEVTALYLQGGAVNLRVATTTILNVTGTTTTFSGSAFAFGTAVITHGATVAATGDFRIKNAWTLVGRNQTNTTDNTLFNWDSSNVFTVGGGVTSTVTLGNASCGSVTINSQTNFSINTNSATYQVFRADNASVGIVGASGIGNVYFFDAPIPTFNSGVNIVKLNGGVGSGFVKPTAGPTGGCFIYGDSGFGIMGSATPVPSTGTGHKLDMEFIGEVTTTVTGAFAKVAEYIEIQIYNGTSINTRHIELCAA